AAISIASGNVVYDPRSSAALQALGAGQTTTDTFTYTMRDAAGATATAMVTVTITGVNDAPVASGDMATTSYDASVTVNVLANDHDVDAGDVLVTSLVSDAEHGSVVRNTDGTFTYTPNAPFNGRDSFTYQIADSHGGTATATVSIDVTGKTIVGTAGNDV